MQSSALIFDPKASKVIVSDSMFTILFDFLFFTFVFYFFVQDSFAVFKKAFSCEKCLQKALVVPQQSSPTNCFLFFIFLSHNNY
jgi:hypothetical protein